MMPTAPGWQVGWADIIGAFGALILIGGAVIVTVRVIHPMMRKLTLVLEQILGRPKSQGIPGVPSMIERFDTIDSRLTTQDKAIADIKEQVTPNHGSTSKLSEDVQDIGAALEKLTKRFDEHLAKP